MLSAGGFLEPFFEYYPFHKREEILKMLEPYKIGIMHPRDEIRPVEIPEYLEEIRDEIEISDNLIRHQNFPLNAETESTVLVESFITPAKEFYLRNHNLMPGKPDLDYYKFKVYNGKQKLKSFYLEDLEAIQKDKQHSVVTTVGCAGLRRAEFKDEGLIDQEGKVIYITNEEKLVDWANLNY